MTLGDDRREVAALLRQLGHDFVARDVPAPTLSALRVELQGMLERVGQAEPRRRVPLSGTKVEGFARAVADSDGGEFLLFDDSLVSGAANPLGLGARLRRDGDVAVLEVSLGAAFTGAPDRAHGGVIAALVDEAMGLALLLHGQLAYTARLHLDFRAPSPVGQLLVARARLVERTGRKLTIDATVRCGELVVAEATALFIAAESPAANPPSPTAGHAPT